MKLLDKNGRQLKKGQWVTPLATHAEYSNPRLAFLTDEFMGQKFNELILVDGQKFCRLFIYKNGDTNYHSVEIYGSNSEKDEDDGWVIHNLNDSIRFKLTELGVKFIEKLNSDHYVYCKYPLEYRRIGIWYETELWQFSNIFGKEFGNGFDNLVETEIRIKRCM